MTILVTGGSGFIGSVVVRMLLERGYQVRCLLRPTSNTKRLTTLDYERVEGDVRELTTILAGMDGCQAVIHLACLSAWDRIDSPEMEDVAVGGTRTVLDAAGKLGNVRVVFVSSITAVGATSAPWLLDEDTSYNLLTTKGLTYSHAKHRAEMLCQQAVRAGLDVVIVNPAEVYGPNDTALVTAGNLVDFATSNPVFVCHGGTSIAYVDDVAVGAVHALEKGRRGERYILGGPNLTLSELARLCLNILGKKPCVITLPNGVIKTLTRVATTLRIPLPYNPRAIPYATRYWFVDSGKAQRELDTRFRSARDTLAPTLAWLQQAGYIS
jgi:dihydroflavonol-4-reductase